jgi:polyribonucleotide nucleotidyltransferase
MFGDEDEGFTFDEDRPTGRKETSRREPIDEPMPELYSVLRGKVVSIQDYGAFVALEGRKRQGLCHVSQISKQKVSRYWITM